ncbi:MAG: SPFH domain-containing protein [Phycisphaerae bacterium]
MTETSGTDDRRAQHVALLGGLVQLAAVVVVQGVSIWSDRPPLLEALSRFMLVGLPIWLVVYLVLNQIRRVGVEALETRELRRAQETGTSQAIFELDDEALLLEQNRLKWMVHWLFPACTIVLSLVLLVGQLGFWGLSFSEALDTDALQHTRQPTLVMWFVVAVGFGCLLFARYALAVSRLPQWGLIRSGAVCLAGGALACVATVVALMSTRTIRWTEGAASYVMGVALFLLGVELAVNFVLNLYRPRTPGEIPRPAFDSRLLGMISEPGGLAKSIADAVNYQFGFQVSSTWFYQLLQRWLFPITVAAAVVVLSLTSVVIVDAHEQVVIERFGRLVGTPPEILTPGVYIKYPYPIDIAYRTPVKRVGELVIGQPDETDEAHEHGEADEHEQAVLWTQKHEFVPEMMLLVASPKAGALSEDAAAGEKIRDKPASGDGGAGGHDAVTRRAPSPADRVASATEGTESVAVSLLMVSVPIEHRVQDIKKYLHNYTEPERLVESVAYRYLSQYAAGVDLDRFMGPGREQLGRDLKRQVQAQLDELGTGIEIVLVGIREAHPPTKANVARAFQSVVAAETEMAADIHAARGAARGILISIAGTEDRATALDEAIRARDRLTAGSPARTEAQRRIDELLLGDPARGIAPVSGEAAAALAQAGAEASEQISRAASKAMSFGTQLAAFQAAPNLYRQRKTLEAYAALGNIRKYLIVGDRSNVIIEYLTQKEEGLDQVLREGVEKERKK